MAKGASYVALLLLCGHVVVSQAQQYVCDTTMLLDVDDTLYDLDYDQRKQQGEIDAFNLLLDGLLEAAAGNNTCGAEEFHNIDSSAYSVLLGGCENDIYEGADWSALGGGQTNWAYTDAQYASINGGQHNIATGDWTSVGGGIKNKAYSNYATVLGGYLNKANAKFACVAGGSKNTVAGRYGMVMGTKVKVTGDYSAGLGFSNGDDCFVRGANTFGMCTEQFILSGDFGEFDVLATLTARRQLREVSKQVEDVEEENEALERAVHAKIATLLKSGRVAADAAASITALLSSL